jgi:hypothetical protein
MVYLVNSVSHVMVRKKRSASSIRFLAVLSCDILIVASIFAVTLTIVTAAGSGIRAPLATANRA